MTFDEVWKFADAIPGSFTRKSGEVLFSHAMNCKGGTIVEVGVDQGRSASILLHVAATTGCRVVLVDSWESCLIENKPKVEEMVERFGVGVILYMESVDAAVLVNGPIDMIHIDANHYDPRPAEDCIAWLPKVKPGGIACFHDYGATFPAVDWAVDTYCRDWEDLGVWDGLAVRRKR